MNGRSDFRDRSGLSKTSGVFLVEGEGAISDFLRMAPELVIQVGSSSVTGSQVVDRLSEKFEFRRAPQGYSPSKAPVWAEAELSAIDEPSFFCELRKSSPPLVLACSNVTDPRNLGAIIRSAAYFGVPYVLLPKDRQVGLTQVVVSTSRAGLAFTKIVAVTNLNRCLDALKKSNYWILGADAKGENVARVSGFYDLTCLVLGAEDRGLGTQTIKRCDRLVGVESHRSGLDSLNVAVAAGILISYLSEPGSIA